MTASDAHPTPRACQPCAIEGGLEGHRGGGCAGAPQPEGVFAEAEDGSVAGSEDDDEDGKEQAEEVVVVEEEE